MNLFKNTYIRLIAFLCIIATGAIYLRTSYAASAPELFITWHTQTYVPREFSGKAMPIASSRINASFELIDGGKLVDISKQTVYWYLNDNLLTGGPGIQTVTFRAPEVGGGGLSLRVQLPDYSPNTLVVKTVDIPIVFPRAVIESPTGTMLPRGTPVIKALPYFFNVINPSALSIIWNVNGERPQNYESPDFLSISTANIPSGTNLSVELSINNPSGTLETGGDTTTFTVQ